MTPGVRSRAGAFVVAIGAVLVLLGTANVRADDARSVLVLRDQRFYVTDTIELDYVLIGDLEVSTSPANTTTTTLIPADDAAPEEDTGSSETTSSTTTSTVPIPVAIPSDAGLVRVALHRPVTDRFGVATALTSDAGPIVDVLTVPLANVVSVDDDGRLTLRLDVPTMPRVGPTPRELDVLEYVDEGVAPVSVSVMSNGSIVAAHTTMIDIGLGRQAPAPMEFAVVAAIGGADTVANDTGTNAVVDQTTRLLRVRTEVEALYAVLNDSSLPVLVAWDPSLNALLEEGGLTVGLDDGADTPFRDLMATSAELAALPDRRIDPSAAALAGLDDLFADEMVRGIDALTATFPDTQVRRSVWFAHPAVTETAITVDGARALRTLGTRAVVMTWDAFTLFDGRPTGPIDTTLSAALDLGAGVTMPILIVDPVMSAFDVSAASGAASPTDRAVRVLAEMTTLRRSDAGLARRVLIAGNDLTPPDAQAVNALERLLIDDPAGVSGDPLSLTAITAASSGIDTVVWGDGPDVDLATRRLVIQGLLEQIDDVASMLPDGDARPETWRSQLIDLYESRLTVERFDSVTAEVSAALAAIRSAVVLPASGTFNLTGRDSPLPLQIENTGDTALSVLVKIASAKLEVPPDPVPVILAPGTTVVRVEVAARANGTFPVLVEVLSPRGLPVVEATTVTARANSVTGLGRLVAVGLVLVLLSWWYSHLRKGRRSDVDRLLDDAISENPSASRSSDT
jgi:hypothetical protein